MKSEIEVANQMTGKKIIFKKNILDDHIFSRINSMNQIEEKNIENLSGGEVYKINYFPFTNRKKLQNLILN